MFSAEISSTNMEERSSVEVCFSYYVLHLDGATGAWPSIAVWPRKMRVAICRKHIHTNIHRHMHTHYYKTLVTVPNSLPTSFTCVDSSLFTLTLHYQPIHYLDKCQAVWDALAEGLSPKELMYWPGDISFKLKSRHIKLISAQKHEYIVLILLPQFEVNSLYYQLPWWKYVPLWLKT